MIKTGQAWMQTDFSDLAFSLQPTSSLGLLRLKKNPNPSPCYTAAKKSPCCPTFPSLSFSLIPKILQPDENISERDYGIMYLLIYLLKTFSICFCWNLPLITSWLLPSIEPLWEKAKIFPLLFPVRNQRTFIHLMNLKYIQWHKF